MASERTALAWARTGLSLLVVAAAVMAAGVRHHLVPLVVAGGPLLIAGTLALLWHTRRAYERRLAEQRWAADPTAALAVVAITLLGVLVAALAGVLSAV